MNCRRLAFAACLLVSTHGFAPAVSRRYIRQVGRNERRRSDYESDYDDDFDKRRKVVSPARGDARRRPPTRNSRSAEYCEDDHDEEEDFEDDDETTDGNSWSNPPSVRYSRSRRSGGRTPAPRPRSRPRTSVRTSESLTAPVISDIYSRMFWSGFDPSDTEGVGDKSVIGGTKGKFNGLAFMAESSRGRRPPTRGGYEDGDGYFDVDDRDYPMSREQHIKSRGDYPQDGKRSARKQPTSYEEDEYEYERNDLEGEDYSEDDDRYARDTRSRRVREREINGIDDEDYFDSDRDGRRDDGRESRDRRESRRRRRRDDSSFPKWSPLNVFDTFLGVDRRKMNYQAERYNENMGITSNSGNTRRRRRKERPRRPGYAYRYEGSDDDANPPVADFDPFDEPLEEDMPRVETQKKPPSKIKSSSPTQRTREPSWEERSMAVQRVPPANISAWGPSGDMGIDARTKAIEDALEDIQLATQRLIQRQEKETLAEEDMKILKVDAELQRRRIAERTQGSGIAKERLRQVELEIEDASRALRRTRTQTQLARDRLEELEERHWALFRLYTPDGASGKVDEALLEFQQIEPAASLEGFENARRYVQTSVEASAGVSTKASEVRKQAQDALQ